MAGKVVLYREEEIELIKESSLLVSKTLGEVAKYIKPGVSTLFLDELAESFIKDHGGVPAFKNYKPSFSDAAYEYSLCISINEEVVHGLPGKDKCLLEGDVVSIDCGVQKNGYFGDSAYTFAVGEISAKKKKLLSITQQSLEKGVLHAISGNRVGDISYAVQFHAEVNGFHVVREMVGHGVGKHLHEDPEIPNFGKRKTGALLQTGMVIAIEPMINIGTRHIEKGKDGWAIIAADKQSSAHFEHTVVVRENKPEVLTTFEFIEN